MPIFLLSQWKRPKTPKAIQTTLNKQKTPEPCKLYFSSALNFSTQLYWNIHEMKISTQQHPCSHTHFPLKEELCQFNFSKAG